MAGEPDEELSGALQEVSNQLWRERDLLDAVAYKLEMERLVLASGSGRWLARATRELDGVLDQLRAAELVRSLKVDELADLLGIAPSPSLRVLVAALPEPWDEIFRQHREAFLELVGTIRTATETNRTLLTAGRVATRAALAWLEDPHQEPPAAGAHTLVDEADPAGPAPLPPPAEPLAPPPLAPPPEHERGLR